MSRISLVLLVLCIGFSSTTFAKVFAGKNGFTYKADKIVCSSSQNRRYSSKKYFIELDLNKYVYRLYQTDYNVQNDIDIDAKAIINFIADFSEEGLVEGSLSLVTKTEDNFSEVSSRTVFKINEKREFIVSKGSSIELRGMQFEDCDGIYKVESSYEVYPESNLEFIVEAKSPYGDTVDIKLSAKHYRGIGRDIDSEDVYFLSPGSSDNNEKELIHFRILLWYSLSDNSYMEPMVAISQYSVLLKEGGVSNIDSRFGSLTLFLSLESASSAKYHPEFDNDNRSSFFKFKIKEIIRPELLPGYPLSGNNPYQMRRRP